MRANRKRSGVRGALAAVATAGLVTGMLTLTGGTASAVPLQLDQKYTCKFPIINNDPIEIRISADMPTSMKVGETVPEYDIKAVTKVSARAAQGLGVMGAVTLEGKATADVVVALPGGEGTLPIKVVNTVAKANIPNPAAAFEVDATGKSPGDLLTWAKPGTAKFDVTGLKLHNMIARDAEGKPVQLPPFGDEFDTACTLGADQPTLLHTMEILGDDPGPGPGPNPTTGKQNVNTKVTPKQGGGQLTMAQAGDTVALSPVEEGTAGSSTGDLQKVTVKDARNGATGWSLTGKVTDFTGNAGTIGADKLGWTPSCATAPGSASTCVPGTKGPVGGAGATLASAPDGAQTGGEFTVGAGLALDVPATAAAGDYAAVLTLTLT
ncbi:hypothetical protein OG302_36380 [Streptomyces sp. NBC_01283]|uniref:DUF6801 domain-containing protein n=1 Tax=Streptomyces sp. NBC_01283 TaxID=2903812 RepID=UPI00352E723B|nr:hypothetical protein OG302_36380 [Streptomyces sp. NBC_01283]